MIVRPMRADDAAAVAALSGQLGYPATAAQTRERFDSIVRLSEGQVLVAENDDAQVIGWIHIRANHLLESDAFGEIAGLVVTEAERGRGVGRALVEAAEDWASEHGYRTLRVRSNVVRDRARKFYEQLGYDLIKTQNNFRKVIR